jgi:hypothetical protein
LQGWQCYFYWQFYSSSIWVLHTHLHVVGLILYSLQSTAFKTAAVFAFFDVGSSCVAGVSVGWSYRLQAIL